MASSSSSSLPHGKQPRPYEVFISFRGIDARNNFVSHLYSALKDRGIRTYYDEDNLQEGQTLGPELIKAIEESSIAIVVLTRNYGSSTWCMTELVKILECQKTFNLVVFPIFYDVDPSDVRKHKVNLKDNVEMLEIWKKALEEVAGIKGNDIRGKNEASCIKEIVNKMLMQLPVKASEFRKCLVGIESRISEIKKMMKTKSDEVLFIGLWGMGGIGKTTTARAIFEDCKDEFEGNCFLHDVKGRKNTLHILQRYLLSDVLKTEFDGIHDVVRGSTMIQERLQFKKVLIVIDDVDNIKQLNALAKHCNWFGVGSRIIITTRDRHLIDFLHIEEYCVKVLLDNEAFDLFCLHAFKDEHPPEDYKELSLQVLKYAGGLPLALQVLGDHLHRRKKFFWMDVVDRLKVAPEDEIISTLQISFDGLNVLQQHIFLDIACTFRSYSKDRVEEALECLGLHPKEGIDVLIQKSLIYISDSCIHMHDLLQEMGWNIVRKRSAGDIKRYSHLWLKHDILEVLSNTTGFSEAERILCTDCRYDGNGDGNGDGTYTELGWELTLKIMNKLSFLQVFGDLFNGNYDVSDSQALSQLGNKLRWFDWSCYPGKSLPKSFRPTNLVQLHMERSDIEETPDFSHMPNLEVLNLFYSSMLVHVHPSLGNLKKIKRVNLARCSQLEVFPKINHMQSLELLDLSDTRLGSFPEINSNLNSLRKLGLSVTCIEDVPTSIRGNATALQTLNFRCSGPNKKKFRCLEFVAKSFLGLVTLQTLNFRWSGPNKKKFRSLEFVAKSFPGLVTLQITFSGIKSTLDFSYLPNLEKVNLSWSKELVHVHTSLGVHKRIKSINFTGCLKLEEFPTIVDMESLEELILSNTTLQNFREIWGNLDSLRKLDLRVTSERDLQTSRQGDATSLRTRRPKKKVFRSLELIEKSFVGLVTLDISFSPIIQTPDFSDLPYLKKLDISDSKELIAVHESLVVHKRIKSINLRGCLKLEEFPTIVDMESLEELSLFDTKLQKFPEISGNLDSLRELNLGKTQITTFSWSIGRATNLEILRIRDCDYLVTLPISFLGLGLQLIDVSSRSLKYFEENIEDYEVASGQSNITEQLIGSQGTGQLPGLKIIFTHCKSLEELPECLLSRIETLDIVECSTLSVWICANVVRQLDKYQYFNLLQIRQDEYLVRRAFSDWESISNMLRKREKPFKVYTPGVEIPRWLRYQFSRPSITVFLPPSLEWYTDNLRGFVISNVNDDLKSTSVLTTDENYSCSPYRKTCDCHVLVMYIPFDGIRKDMGHWDGESECTLLEVSSNMHLCTTYFLKWGLSLVYEGGEVNAIDPDQLIIYSDNKEAYMKNGTFTVKLAGSRDRMEMLNKDNFKDKGPMSWALFRRLTY